jgi:hypothetical protein
MIWTKPNTGQAPSTGNGNGWPGSENVRLAACGEEKKVSIVADAIPSFKQGFSPRHLAP